MCVDHATEIEAAFYRYLDAYFQGRDLGATLALLSSRFSGFGTGLDECVFNPDGAQAIYQRDIAQVPNPIRYQLHRPPHIQQPSTDIGLICAEFDIETKVLKQTLVLRHLRSTMVFVRHPLDQVSARSSGRSSGRSSDQSSGWLIEHIHISLPTQAHGEDESYPIKELEDRNQLLERLVAENTKELHQAIEQISQLATTDSLTGLSNRLKLDDYLAEAIARAQHESEPLALILLDLDHFKQINDTHGHLHGDRILTELSALLAASIRTTDLLGRWGGEEFLVICSGMTLEAAIERAERMREAVRTHRFPGLDQPQTASFGVACYRHGESGEQLVARADVALYLAKQAGRDCVVKS